MPRRIDDSEDEASELDEQDLIERSETFKPDGKPVRFFIQVGGPQGVTQVRAERLQRAITNHGGEVTPNHEKANTVIVKNQRAVDKRREYYNGYMNNIYVEPPRFIHERIILGTYAHVQRPFKKMPGRPIGSRGERFTNEDKRHLIEYIAIKIPKAEDGGRSGDTIYKRLEQLGRDDDTGQYTWVKKHPWSSWQNHYKKNREYFDSKIQAFVDRHPDLIHSKARYERSNQVNRRRFIDVDVEDVPFELGPEEDAGDVHRESPPRREEEEEEEVEQNERVNHSWDIDDHVRPGEGLPIPRPREQPRNATPGPSRPRTQVPQGSQATLVATQQPTQAQSQAPKSTMPRSGPDNARPPNNETNTLPETRAREEEEEEVEEAEELDELANDVREDDGPEVIHPFEVDTDEEKPTVETPIPTPQRAPRQQDGHSSDDERADSQLFGKAQKPRRTQTTVPTPHQPGTVPSGFVQRRARTASQQPPGPPPNAVPGSSRARPPASLSKAIIKNLQPGLRRFEKGRLVELPAREESSSSESTVDINTIPVIGTRAAVLVHRTSKTPNRVSPYSPPKGTRAERYPPKSNP
ncbi:hypothetical protein NLI96_g8390 [Meripilus lineatus]|uniref:DNA-binding protein RAP1 n=1 Tax=Meripilus lineatus TaxID=2056292 RepID=A0AAD5YC18_9APHY|nr:hypothetical protein NLI96_g8390 [Physisporinus lineatus]